VRLQPGVEPAGGLVEKYDFWLADECHRQIQSAAHPTGVGGGHHAGGFGQLESLKQLGRATTPVGATHMGQVSKEHQVLVAGQEVVHRGELSGDADGAAYGVRLQAEVVAGYAHLAHQEYPKAAAAFEQGHLDRARAYLARLKKGEIEAQGPRRAEVVYQPAASVAEGQNDHAAAVSSLARYMQLPLDATPRLVVRPAPRPDVVGRVDSELRQPTGYVAGQYDVGPT